VPEKSIGFSFLKMKAPSAQLPQQITAQASAGPTAHFIKFVLTNRSIEKSSRMAAWQIGMSADWQVGGSPEWRISSLANRPNDQ
jgi:hypothetical protein